MAPDSKNKIGDRAKDVLLKEAVGFANAYGGAVLLGYSVSPKRTLQLLMESCRSSDARPWRNA